MPLHDVGYRSWEGAKTWLGSRWLVVTTTGIKLAFRSSWLSRALVLSWLPALILGVLFFFYEQSITVPDYRRPISGLVAASGSSSEIVRAALQNPGEVRHEVWSSLLLVFFRYPQGILMIILMGIIAPRLIAHDLRNRGYLLYFSRPIRVSGYVAGKALILWTFLAMITTVPALVLYVIGLSLSPDLNVIWSTWDLPLRILLASLVLMIPLSSVALACSAMTIETRYAAFSWFAIWVVGWTAYSVLRIGELAGRSGPRRRGRGMPEIVEQSSWELLSPFHVLGRAQQYVFGLYPDDKAIWPYGLVLVLVTVFSLWFVSSRVQARLRA